jgi:rhamnosyltransferase
MSEPIRPKVSVIIRAFNEGQHLGRLLHGLRSQTTVPDEIVLVDSGSTDHTVEIAEAGGCRVVHIGKEEFSFGRALNRGCEKATGDILLIVSAHVYPVYDTYIEHMVGAFQRDGVGVAYGRQVGDHRTKYSESRIMLRWFPTDNIWDQGHPFSNNANAAVRMNIWESIRYDESLTGLEDLAFAKEVIARGHKVSYVADAPVVHVHEETWQTIRNRYRREAIAYSKIDQDSRMSAATAIYLAAKNILADYGSAIRSRQLAPNLTSIPRFRVAQFFGAWEGFRIGDDASRGLIQRFYYPPEATRRSDSPLPGTPVSYQKFEAEEIH